MSVKNPKSLRPLRALKLLRDSRPGGGILPGVKPRTPRRENAGCRSPAVIFNQSSTYRSLRERSDAFKPRENLAATASRLSASKAKQYVHTTWDGHVVGT